MKDIQDMMASSFMKTIQDVQGSSFMNAVRDMQGSAVMSVMRDMQGSAVMSVMRDMQGSTVMNAMRDMQSTTVMSAMRDMQGTTVMSAMRDMQGSSYINAVRDIQDSLEGKAFADLRNSPFNKSIAHEILSDDYVSVYGELSGFATEPLEDNEDVLAELSEVLVTTNDYNSLSDRSKQYLIQVYRDYLLPFIIGCLATIFVNTIEQAQDELLKAKSPAEIKILMRSPSVRINKDLLNEYRVSIGEGLRLRSGPGMKHRIISNLPLGKLLEVVDSTQRAWVKVKVDVDGDCLEGWVSRRYTAYFK